MDQELLFISLPICIHHRLILFRFYIFSSVISAPGHFCIATLYKFSMYCIVLLYYACSKPHVLGGLVGSRRTLLHQRTVNGHYGYKQGRLSPLKPIMQILLPISTPSPSPFPFPLVLFSSLVLPFPLPNSPPQIQLVGLGERCKLPQQGLGLCPGRKRTLTHLRVSKCTSWHHLSASPQHFPMMQNVSFPPRFRRPWLPT